jgi:TonB-dependent starch-binding outer membrane protein SusC
VILITTKKGRSEAIKTEATVYTGWGRVTRTMDMMNTAQYLQMRNEAFRNDSIVITPGNGYDLLVWDTSRYIDLKKKLIGQTAQINNVTLHISGGSSQISFSGGASYYNESTVFAGNSSDTRISVYSGINYKSQNKKFIFGLNANYASDKNDLIKEDLTQYINLPPVLPELYDSSGNLNWSKGGFSFNNPLSATLQTNKVITDRITASNTIQYLLGKDLTVKVNTGYNQLNTDEYNNTPIAAQDPSITPTGTAFFGANTVKSWIIEPQVDYRFNATKKLRIQTMLGATWQENRGKVNGITASGYTNDLLLESIANAATITAQNHKELYRYNAVFGRLHFNWDNKYLLNLIGRRDGSSRFGPGNQFANFGAIGLAWLFSNERLFIETFKFLSYGKLRFSYGTTGNDLIGNYQYLDSYSPTRLPYQGIPSLFPTKLYNSEYGWEEIKKLNAGVELGFLKDRILITVDWFINKSSDQIISVLRNFPGVVQNTGLEVQVTSINIQGNSLTWKSVFNLTVAKNRLIEFPGLATSSYTQRYLIDKPLNAYIGARFAGVDPATGVYQFFDKDKSLTFSPTTADYVYAGTTDPKFYGGFQNAIKYKGWELSFLLEFRKQMGLHPVYSAPSLVGDAINRPSAVLDRWQSPGQLKPYQRFTQTFRAAGNAIYPLFNSNAVLTDASFIRMKNVAMSYSVPSTKLSKYKITNIELFVQAQNLFVITDYKGPDPETQRVRSLPPIRRIVTGIKLIL